MALFGRGTRCSDDNIKSFLSNYCFRLVDFRLEVSLLFRTVTHLQFLEWPVSPDSEVFPKHLPLVSFVRTVRHFYSLQASFDSPVVLQCKYVHISCNIQPF